MGRESSHCRSRAGQGFLQAGKSRGCDLIIMASSSSRGLERVLLGSQATRVLTHSPVPVLICK
ncbi:MAG: universal stress protein [Bacteroidota bacterium]